MSIENTENELKKDLGLFTTISIVIGIVIGSGIFVKPGKVIAATGSSSLALLAWVIGGIITIAAGLTMAEVGSRITRTGGVYVYIEELYGDTWGHLAGWLQTVCYGPAIIGALSMFFGSLVIQFFGLPDTHFIQASIAIVTTLFLTLANCLGTKYGGWIQNASTLAKLVPIIMIAVFGLFWGKTTVLGMSSGMATGAGMGAAILATLWAYDGWAMAAAVSGEIDNPAKTLPRAIIIGLLVVIAAYLSVNFAMLHVLPASDIAHLNEKAAGVVAGQLFGSFGGKLLSIGILISIFGCLNGKILSFPRVPYAMSLRGQLPYSHKWAKVSHRFSTPINATLLQVALATVFMVLTNPDRLSDVAIFIIYCTYVFVFFGVFILRRRDRMEKKAVSEKTYRVPWYPVVPLVAIVGSTYIIFSTLINTPADCIYSLLITFAGLPVYWYLKASSDKKKETVPTL